MNHSKTLTALLLFTLGLVAHGASAPAQAPSYEELDAIAVDAPGYRSAFLEMQKIHYGKKEWDKFFGYATYYRKHLMTSGNLEQTHSLLLEALALTKHCHYSTAQIILDQARAQAIAQLPAQTSMMSQINAVQDLLDLQARLGGYVRTAAMAPPLEAFSVESHWRIDQERRNSVVEKAVKNPRALRVLVKDLCLSANSEQVKR